MMVGLNPNCDDVNKDYFSARSTGERLHAVTFPGAGLGTHGPPSLDQFRFQNLSGQWSVADKGT